MSPATYERLSIVMPVYNEAATLRVALERLLAVDMPLPTEIVIVDDGSTDGCTELIEDLVDDERVRLVRQDPNQGKGAALRPRLRRGPGRPAHHPRRRPRVRPRRHPDAAAARS